jgi:hypothetical protein
VGWEGGSARIFTGKQANNTYYSESTSPLLTLTVHGALGAGIAQLGGEKPDQGMWWPLPSVPLKATLVLNCGAAAGGAPAGGQAKKSAN